MMEMKKAIILDAGEGKRLRPLTEFTPKCLLRLNEITILEHQLTNLSECGIKKVILVVGYRANQIFQKLEEKNFGLDLKFVRNPIYYKTNTVYSLWLAKEEANEDFVYLNGDVVFHKNVLKRLLDSQFDTCLAIKKKKVGEEEVKVELVSNVIKTIGKKIQPVEAHGEFVGIAKFSQEFNKLFIDKLNEVVGERKVNAFFEVALNRALKHYDVYAIDVSDLPCIEIDSYEDFSVARNIYSRLGKKA